MEKRRLTYVLSLKKNPIQRKWQDLCIKEGIREGSSWISITENRFSELGLLDLWNHGFTNLKAAKALIAEKLKNEFVELAKKAVESK